MRLTAAEYRLLNVMAQTAGGKIPYRNLRHTSRPVASAMSEKGLISKSALDRGYVVATALGKRSHARGKS